MHGSYHLISTVRDLEQFYQVIGKSLVSYYSTGVQIVSCTLSDDSVLSESTGLFNPVLLCQPMKHLLTKKSANQIVSFKSGWAWKRMIPLSTWWLQQAFWRPNWWIYSKYYTEICFIFLNDISLAPKMWICIIDVLVKASWMQCPLHNQKVNKPSFHGASWQFKLAPFNSQTIWTHKVQYLPTAV